MRISSKINCLFCSSIIWFQSSAFANTMASPSAPITHCYHWLDQNKTGKKYLNYKYTHARANNGELTYYSIPGQNNGAAAGPGLYCAKSPVGSFGYGDRVIRVDLVEDVVMLDSIGGGKTYCGQSKAGCKKAWDIRHYSGGAANDYSWYVIRNPQAIASWSANSAQLIADLKLNAGNNKRPAFGQHAQLTLNAIQKETPQIWQNGNSRFSLADIIKDPARVRQYPPLALIAKVASYQDKGGKSISQAERVKLYNSQFTRALKDTKLPYEDFEDLLKRQGKAPGLTNAFTSALSNISSNDYKKYNPVVLLVAFDRHLRNQNFSDSEIGQLWNAILTSQTDLKFIIDAKLSTGNVFSRSFFKSLPDENTLVSNLTDLNQVQIIRVFDYFSKNTSFPKIDRYMTAILTNAITKKKQNLIQVVSTIQNPNLKLGPALASSLESIYSSGKFQGHSPIFVGNLIDKASGHLSSANKGKYINTVTSLPIESSTSYLTYRMLHDYKSGALALPSFISPEKFFKKLFVRLLKERSSKFKNRRTNGYRFLFSDIFFYYKSIHDKATAGAAQDKVRSRAAEFYNDIAASFIDTPKAGEDHLLANAYVYIALQNASFFEGGLTYKLHPMELYINKYLDGKDVAFNKQIERYQPYMIDGTYLLYLMYRFDTIAGEDGGTDKGDKIKELISVTLEHLTKSDGSWADYYDDKKGDDFWITNREKLQWNNIIDKSDDDDWNDVMKPYKRWKNGKQGSYVNSDICLVSKVLFDKAYYKSGKDRSKWSSRSWIGKVFPNGDDDFIGKDSIEEWSNDIYSDLKCKEKLPY